MDSDCGSIRAELEGIKDEVSSIAVETLSFRDRCAIAAMPLAEAYLLRFFEDDEDAEPFDNEQIAEEAFNIADAMEAERQNRMNMTIE